MRLWAWLKRLWWRLLGRKPKPTPTLLDIDQITAKALVILHQKINLIGALNREFEEQKKAGVEPGASLRIRLPVQYTVQNGRSGADARNHDQL